jgi:large subunit ribosomal protein L31
MQEAAMRPNIHPTYGPVVYQDRSTGQAFLTRSTASSSETITWEDGNTYPLIRVDITSYSHPFWTGAQRVLDSAGQVEKFRRRYGGRGRA